MTTNIRMIGLQMGYHFVIGNRQALNFILYGPGVVFYSINTSINFDIGGNYDAELLKKLQEALIDQFSPYSLILKNDEFEKPGTTNTTSLGFRYEVNLGYRL